VSPIELAAVALTVACVLLAVKRSVWQFPIGIAATALYVFVFWRANLYASAGLNVVFSFVQFYGWWFWLRGDHGAAPKVGSWPWTSVAALVGAVLLGSVLVAYGLHSFTDAALPYADAAIFGLSLAAQFLLSRKKIETWAVWGVVNTLSVVTYASQGLWPTAALYAALLLNVFWGWSEWRNAIRADRVAPT
jgi:nicotinamide mononucleotide transporter